LVTQALGSQASESQALESPTSTSSGPMLYSPAAGCPIGYKTPVDQSQGETAIPCCPSYVPPLRLPRTSDQQI
jgi:hypothetical protein